MTCAVSSKAALSFNIYFSILCGHGFFWNCYVSESLRIGDHAASWGAVPHIAERLSDGGWVTHRGQRFPSVSPHAATRWCPLPNPAGLVEPQSRLEFWSCILGGKNKTVREEVT